MDLGIVERLVCPEGHPATPLVVRADDAHGGRLLSGMIGCPECRATWRVTDGVAVFGEQSAMPSVAAPAADVVAALLALTEPGIVIVDGVDAAVASTLSSAFGARLIALDAPATSPGASVINGATRVPVAAGAAAGIVLLRPGRDANFIDSAVRTLASGGRAIGAVALAPTNALREIARDTQFWVAEHAPVSPPVPLRRRAL